MPVSSAAARAVGVTLPGMPIAVGDPGVFICGPGDVAPWEQTSHRPPLSGPAPRRAPSGVWLVARLCIGCRFRDGVPVYCGLHSRENWWLTVYDGPPFGKRHTP